MPLIPHGSLATIARDLLLLCLSDAAGTCRTGGDNSQVEIVSPWISDIRIPAAGESPFASDIPNHLMPSDNVLSEYIQCLGRVGCSVTITTLPVYQNDGILGKTPKQVIRERDFLLATRLTGTNVQTVAGLHAKLLSTPQAAIVGSSNLTQSGYGKHRELNYLIVKKQVESEDRALAKEISFLLEGAQPWSPDTSF